MKRALFIISKITHLSHRPCTYLTYKWRICVVVAITFHMPMELCFSIRFQCFFFLSRIWQTWDEVCWFIVILQQLRAHNIQDIRMINSSSNNFYFFIFFFCWCIYKDNARFSFWWVFKYFLFCFVFNNHFINLSMPH